MRRRRHAIEESSPPLTGEEFEKSKCVHCGGAHLRACPRVRRMRFFKGTLVEVEFWADGDWPTADIVWPEEVYDAQQHES